MEGRALSAFRVQQQICLQQMMIRLPFSMLATAWGPSSRGLPLSLASASLTSFRKRGSALMRLWSRSSSFDSLMSSSACHGGLDRSIAETLSEHPSSPPVEAGGHVDGVEAMSVLLR
jgi:hypothetical protein